VTASSAGGSVSSDFASDMAARAARHAIGSKAIKSCDWDAPVLSSADMRC
jgi:hypothetical protein